MTAAYTVSVRSLCEFTAKRGDLDRRFTPSATALEGLQGQQGVASRRGPDYQTELRLEATLGTLTVRGRADGYDPQAHRLEEVKTIRGRPEDLPDNRRALHWAQLETYGALYCHAHGCPELTLALVYVDVASQGETVLRETRSAAQLAVALAARCDAFVAWSQQEANHRAARDLALAALAFPLPDFRPGQRALAHAVYRAASHADAGQRCLLAQAPTGIGKTLGVLFPLLRAMPAQGIDKLGYLTCKGTGRHTALDALARLREATPGRALRVITLVAKTQACEHPDKACHGDACPLARGFYDRLPAARAEAVATGWMDPATQRRVALAHGICPYYLGQELLRWADVVVGDVHHAFDTHGQLHGLAQALDWRLALAVDEAHNLIDRARAMYSASLSLGQIHAALALAPAALRPRLGRLLQLAADTLHAQPADHSALDALPQPLLDALQGLSAALGEHLQLHPLATGPLLQLHFDLLRLLRLIDRLDTHSVVELLRGAASAAAVPRDPSLGDTTVPDAGRQQASLPDLAIVAPADLPAQFGVRCIVPGAHLRERFAACHTATLFSATLGSADYQRHLLGLPEHTGWLDVPPPYDPAHLQVRVARRLSTRFAHRAASLDGLVALMARQFTAHPGNYLAFFSSFQYMAQAADRLARLAPQLPQWRQARAMDAAQRQGFLARFQPASQGIGFAVLGGAFAEGVDLPGSRLIGAFIATLGLPPVSPAQDINRARLDALFGEGHGYADLLPGLQKVVQAAGRVIRGPEDRGWLWLIDDRYQRPEVQALLPPWWQIGAPSPGATDSSGDPGGPGSAQAPGPDPGADPAGAASAA